MDDLIERLRAYAREWHNAEVCDEAADALTTLQSDKERMREALEQIAVYGCGMLSQPAALNGSEAAWLSKRIAEYERVARQAITTTDEATGR